MTAPFDIAAARERLRVRDEERRSRLHKEFRAACAERDAIIETIISGYSPVRIWLWGSLLDENRFTEMSDIDIAVEGIGSAERFFSLYGNAMKLTKRSLDIVEIDKMEPEFADLVRMKGRLVYERPF